MSVSATYTFDPEKVYSGKSLIVSTLKFAAGTIAFDSSYSTGGESFTIPGITIKEMIFGQSGGYTFEYDTTNETILVYNVPALDGATAAAQALAEVTDSADLSGLTAVQFFAIGT